MFVCAGVEMVLRPCDSEPVCALFFFSFLVRARLSCPLWCAQQSCSAAH